MRLIHYFYILLLSQCALSAHASTIDSLEQILKNDQPIIEKHEAVLALAKEINWSAPKRAMQLVDTLRQVPHYQKDSTAILALCAIEAKALRGTGDYPQSIALYKSNFAYYQRHDDSLGMAGAAGQIGIMNTFNGNLVEGQKWLFKSHELYQSVGSAKQKAGANNALAIFYMDMDQREKGYERYLMAMEQYQEAKDSSGLANVNANLGLAYIEDKNFEKAEIHLRIQGHLDSLLETQWGLGFYHDFMGYLREEQGDLKSAYRQYQVALSIRKKLDSHYNRAESQINLSRVLNKMGKHREAVTEANKVFDDQAKSESLSQQQSGYEILASGYQSLGQYKAALEAQKNYQMISDSIYKRDQLEQITKNDARFERAEMDGEIALLNERNEYSEKLVSQQRIALTLGGIGLVMISLLSFSLWKIYQKVKKKNRFIQKTLDEKELLLREIHHRVKNNLQFISSLLNMQSRSINDEKVAKAINEGKARVRSMALIHQDLYQRDNLLGVSVRSYLDKLSNELFNTYHIDSNQIDLDLHVEDLVLDVDTLIPLGLIINELITNCLKYAFPDDRAGKIDISLYEKDNNLILKVADNGIGVDFDNMESKKSFGHFLIKTLTRQLKGEFDVRKEQGTSVEMKFTKYKLAS